MNADTSDKDLFGNPIKEPVKKLKDWFVVPPFSILNSASGEWQEKKKIWMIKINDRHRQEKTN